MAFTQQSENFNNVYGNNTCPLGGFKHLKLVTCKTHPVRGHLRQLKQRGHLSNMLFPPTHPAVSSQTCKKKKKTNVIGEGQALRYTIHPKARNQHEMRPFGEPCFRAQAGMARTAREHEVRTMYRITSTCKTNHCDYCYDIRS